MTAQHTPGPWFIWKELAMQREGRGKDEIDDELLFSGEHGIYAGNPSECTKSFLRGHTSHICDIDPESNFDFDDDDDEDLCKATALANARLIAAAPTMYEYIQFSASNGCEQAKTILEAIYGNT